MYYITLDRDIDEGDDPLDCIRSEWKTLLDLDAFTPVGLRNHSDDIISFDFNKNYIQQKGCISESTQTTLAP
jgi:hypothetical protein